MILKTAALGGTGAVGLALALAATISHGRTLHSPFPDVALPAGSTEASGATCAPVPAAVRDINSASKYGADRRENDSTVVDPAAAAKYTEATEPVVDFSRQISKFADMVAEHRQTAPDDTRCAVAWLDGWARQGALLGSMSENGEAVRKWELATLAAAYLKVRDMPHDKAADERVRHWLQQLGSAVRADYSRGVDRDSRQNNHLYWAAWAVMAAGIASDDRALFDWSIDRFRFALGQIAADGTLPLELKRRQLALSYHAFALGPLIMLREGATSNGVELTAEENRRLQLLTDRVVNGLADPAYFAAKAGVPQDLDKVTNTQLAWLETYYARSHDQRALAEIAPRRPLTAARLGGNLTAIYAALAAPAHRPPAQD